MTRIGALVGLTVLLATAACAGNAKTTATPVAAASAGTALDPVPENTATPAHAAAPRPHHPSPAPKTPEPSPTTDAGSGDAALDRFVAAVQKQLPGVALDRRDEEVEALGEQACAGLRAGKTDTAVAGEIGAADVAPADARKLVTLARSTACPGRPKVGGKA